MTWIVGMPTIFGYSIGISDIRVTLRDGTEHDCLQKIYPIAQSIALGFAGSVLIGFAMVDVMKKWLHSDAPEPAWHPLEVVELWPEIARGVFAAAPPDERNLHSHLIVLSADPQHQTGLGAKTYVHILRSPDFSPVQVQVSKVAGIGSGNFIDEYRLSLQQLSENHEVNFGLMRGEQCNPGGMGTMLGFSITRLIKESNPSGISSHLHYCWVYLGTTIIKTNDHFTAGRWTGFDSGSGINRSEHFEPSPSIEGQPGHTYFQMPKIAQSWNQLQEMLESAGARAEGSVA